MEENNNLHEVNQDETGKPAEKKGLNWKEIGKKILFGLGCAGVGIITFLAVGAAMIGSDSSEEGSEEGTDSEGTSGTDGGEICSGESSAE